MEPISLETPALRIPREEVLRYLGHRPGQEIGELLPLLREGEEILLQAAQARFTLSRWTLERSGEALGLAGGSLILPGRDIAGHLKASRDCLLLAATLGQEVERKIQYHGHRQMALSLILDATATAAIEALCDDLEDALRRRLGERGEDVTTRFSPGYGDLPIGVQRNFIAVTDAGRRIGLTVSDSHILIPRKSVTAIMGVVPRGTLRSPRGCSVCANAETCQYRKEGITCGV